MKVLMIITTLALAPDYLGGNAVSVTTTPVDSMEACELVADAMDGMLVKQGDEFAQEGSPAYETTRTVHREVECILPPENRGDANGGGVPVTVRPDR